MKVVKNQNEYIKFFDKEFFLKYFTKDFFNIYNKMDFVPETLPNYEKCYIMMEKIEGIKHEEYELLEFIMNYKDQLIKILEFMLEYKVYHADMHGNMIIREKDNKLFLIDPDSWIFFDQENKNPAKEILKKLKKFEGQKDILLELDHFLSESNLLQQR